MRTAVWLVLWAGCASVDADGDGIPAKFDCDDGDPDVRGPKRWFVDQDGDRVGGTETRDTCDAGPGLAVSGDDCDDHDPARSPLVAEQCNNTDDDCDGSIDEQLLSSQFWWDADADGYGDPGASTLACGPFDGRVSNADDCDDDDARTHPGAVEVCDGEDQDCNGAIDDSVGDAWYRDRDGDGWGDTLTTTRTCDAPGGYVARDGDCDDWNGTIAPAAPERCNGGDDDCDGLADEEATLGLVESWQDADLDRYGDPAYPAWTCEVPDGYAANELDCDDTDPELNPYTIWYADRDGDGYGWTVARTRQCEPPPGHTRVPYDCDDTDEDVHPGGTEVCNGVDDDCDGALDSDALDASTVYADFDADGYGDPRASLVTCEELPSWIADDGDCDDRHDTVHPGAAEVCDGLDNQCDGLIDEDDPALLDASTWWPDGDADGYGAGTSVTACDAPSGYVASDEDCDDAAATVSPAAVEWCDDLDDDCDGLVDLDDPDAASLLWYRDTDGDGYGDPDATVRSCSHPASTLASAGDCDDAAADVHPGAVEQCANGLDDDCDGDEVRTCLSAEMDIADAPVMLYGDTASDHLGTGLSTIGDVDGDGLDDLLVADAHSGSAGEVFLVLGADLSTGTVDDAAHAVLEGAALRDAVGEAIAGLGDVTGDGVRDWAAWSSTLATVYLISGDAEGTLAVTDAASTLWSRQAFGRSIAGPGDVDADGYADLWIGGTGHDSGTLTNCGAMFLFLGPISAGSIEGEVEADAVLEGSDAAQGAGEALDAGRDLDGDGAPDAIVGSNAGVAGYGFAWIVTDPASGTSSLADATAVLATGSKRDGFGEVVRSIGDLDGDGYGDLAAGDNNAEVYVLSGPFEGTIDADSAATIALSDVTSLAAAGDVDLDGLDDLLVGDTRAGSSLEGAAYVVLGGAAGRVDWDDGDIVITGSKAGDNVGWTVAAGDFDGDGIPDVATGSLQTDEGGTDAGTIYLFFGGAS